MWRDSPGPGLTASAARALVEHTGGSPALVRPLLEQFTAAIWSGSPEHPVRGELVTSVANTLKRMLPEGAALTEAAAVLGVRSQLARAVELAGVKDTVAAVDAANAAGLLRLSTANAETRLEFPLPVVRAAVYQHLGPGRRVGLHTAAAAIMTDPLQRLNHRAAAALLPDASLAAELESTAEYFASSGAWHRAAESYAQAARLNPELSERELLLVKAVDAMVGAGADCPGPRRPWKLSIPSPRPPEAMPCEATSPSFGAAPPKRTHCSIRPGPPSTPPPTPRRPAAFASGRSFTRWPAFTGGTW